MCDDHVGEEGQAAHLQAPPLPALTSGRRHCHGDCPQPSRTGQEGQAGPGNNFRVQHHFHTKIQAVAMKNSQGPNRDCEESSLLSSVFLYIIPFPFIHSYYVAVGIHNTVSVCVCEKHK